MNNFMTLHPLLTVSVIGSFLGTVLAYIVPGFTNNYMCAGRGFRIGNLGFNVFILNGWAHFFGNLMILVPGALMVESLCHRFGCPLAVIVIIAYFAIDDNSQTIFLVIVIRIIIFMYAYFTA